MKRRVVVTGLGCLTPAGADVGGLWELLLHGRSGIGWLTRFDREPYRAQCSGEIRDFELPAGLAVRQQKRLDRYAQFALKVAAEAFADAGLAPHPDRPCHDTGISFGTALGGISEAEHQHRRFLEQGVKAVPPALALQVFGGSAHSQIAIAHGLRGYATTNSNSCASGTVAVGEAFRAIRDGLADVILAGAAEAPLSPLTFAAFDAIKSMSSEKENPARACCPFDKNRSGFVMAEGAAALVLEEERRARKRGARIYAEVLGYALNNDAYHMTSSLPGGESAAEAMRLAMQEAKLEPGQIAYINAHGSSTPMNDAHEAAAIRKVFDGRSPMVSGTKGFYGHSLGAAGAVEAVVCCLAMARDFVPMTLNCREPEIPAGLDLVCGTSRQARLPYVLSNSFGFGGINAVIVLGKADS